MENASKALLIAAGIFLTLLIVSLLVVLHDDISAYYEQKSEMTVIEQNQKFNAKFENYHRNNIRGNDLISFMNSVINYNASQAYNQDKNYERIRVTITLGDEDIRKQFKYEVQNKNVNITQQNQYLNKKTITNTTGGGDKWKNDRELIIITNTPADMCNELQKLGITNPTDNKLQQLASNASNIILSNVEENNEESSSLAYNRFKRAELLEDVLGIKVGTTSDCEIVIDNETGITKNEDGEEIINKIKEITSQYYQYMYFKRAYFDCTEMIYDPDTARVVEMNFELQVKDGTVIFNWYDLLKGKNIWKMQ